MTVEREELDPNIFGPENGCFGCAPTNPIGMHLHPVREGDSVTVRFTPPESFQGAARVMHGGLVTTLADELAAWVIVGLRGQFGFTGSLEARFLKPVRVGVEVEGRGVITDQTRRTVKIEVRLTQAGEEVYRAKFGFVVLDEAGAEKLMAGPLPEAWKKFVRRPEE